MERLTTLPALNHPSISSSDRAAADARAASYRAEFAAKDAALRAAVGDLRADATARFEAALARATGGGAGSAGTGPTLEEAAAGDPAATARAASAAAVRPKLSTAIAALQDGLVERDTEARLLLLAALAGEHILFLGPPGTAKSELGRRLARLTDGSFFERLLTRFTVPEELFGPLSMAALENDQYIRQTAGYLPTATVAFVDEVFKASSAILNALLTLLNERLFDNGTQRLPVPLLTLVGASNELPESEELDALYDRFLIRREVGQVSEAGLDALLRGGSTAAGATATARPATALLTSADCGAIQAAAGDVELPDAVLTLLADLRSHLQAGCEPPVYVSDRRLVKAAALLRVAAAADGRAVASRTDALLLQHVLWQRPGEAGRVGDWIMAALSGDDGLAAADHLFGGMFGRACLGASARPASLPAVAADVASLREVLEARVGALSGAAAAAASSSARNTRSLWLSADDAAALDASLSPRLAKSASAAQGLLFEAVTLEAALAGGAEAVTLADLLPGRWASFIRSGDVEDVRPLGVVPGSLGGNAPYGVP